MIGVIVTIRIIILGIIITMNVVAGIVMWDGTKGPSMTLCHGDFPTYHGGNLFPWDQRLFGCR